jgi:hypothetical protein
MIDDRNKIIFVENPKTATASLKRALTDGPSFDIPGLRNSTRNHDIPRVIRKKFPAEWNSYVKFVVVRNTWDRAHSFFEFYRQIARSDSYQATNFDDWVAAECPPPAEDHLRAPMRAEGRLDDVLCQNRYCEDVDEIIVLRSLDRRIRCQELNDGMRRVCAIAEMESLRIPDDMNDFGRSRQPIEWEPATIERLGARYHDEIAKFGFQPPNA